MKRYPTLRYFDRGGLLLSREGLSLCFYMREQHTEVISRVMTCLDLYLHAVGPHSLTIYADMEGDWYPLDPSIWLRLRHEWQEQRTSRILLSDHLVDDHRYYVHYQGKAMSPEPFHRDNVCALEFWLPTEYLEEHGPQKVRQLALQMAALLPFGSGHVGLSFNAELCMIGVDDEIQKHCFRYPGLSIIDLDFLSGKLGTRINTVSWLTFLGPPVLGELGGAEGLRSVLKTPDTTVEAVDPERVVVTLGEWPEAGDTQEGQFLPGYRELARILEPWHHHRDHRLAGLTLEDTRRWEDRFLD